eukprot:TRINITY_DN562_c0_g1_i6.p1 TRINITY_DN562_c0_g1~~TRINITY_DN562_c0_g1_i6.p1  ORF type:complete len:330 (+),score=44.09 TRINITY_DN562_c0_g1_i6:160-1149(+)
MDVLVVTAAPLNVNTPTVGSCVMNATSESPLSSLPLSVMSTNESSRHTGVVVVVANGAKFTPVTPRVSVNVSEARVPSVVMTLMVLVPTGASAAMLTVNSQLFVPLCGVRFWLITTAWPPLLTLTPLPSDSSVTRALIALPSGSTPLTVKITLCTSCDCCTLIVLAVALTNGAKFLSVTCTLTLVSALLTPLLELSTYASLLAPADTVNDEGCGDTYTTRALLIVPVPCAITDPAASAAPVGLPFASARCSLPLVGVLLSVTVSPKLSSSFVLIVATTLSRSGTLKLDGVDVKTGVRATKSTLMFTLTDVLLAPTLSTATNEKLAKLAP